MVLEGERTVLFPIRVTALTKDKWLEAHTSNSMLNYIGAHCVASVLNCKDCPASYQLMTITILMMMLAMLLRR